MKNSRTLGILKKVFELFLIYVLEQFKHKSY